MMLRCFNEDGGIGVYTRNLIWELLELDHHNHYVLFYRDPANLGCYSHRPNVTEVFLRGAHNAVWDQIAVPWACWRYRVDLVFHPKFTVPLLAPCKAVI